MQSSLNGSSNEPQRPSSVPPKSPSAPLNPTSSLNRSALSKSTTPNPFTASNTPSEVEPEDFGSAWGDDDPIASPNAPKSKSKSSATAADSGWGDDDAGWDVDDADATADAFNDPYGGSRTNTSKPSVAYDDHGEPDFAGWLAAQSQAKQKTKSPLPKGLAKSSAARPSTGLKSNSTGNVNARKAAPAAAPKPKPVAVKKEAPKKEQKVEEEEDGWGDAWE
jgi:SCY1-like protein 1